MNTNFLISVSSAYQHIKPSSFENRNQPTIYRKLRLGMHIFISEIPFPFLAI